MKQHEYFVMRDVEDSYWWYKVLREQTCSSLSRWIGDIPTARVVDAGCGTGGTMSYLRSVFSTWSLSGFDISPLALELTEQRGFTNLTKASVDSIPYPDHSQNAIVSLDVLYHRGVDQEKSMQEFARVIIPAGILIMNLPAYECLRGQHDMAVETSRRYSPLAIRKLHERHGFRVLELYCWNAWLFPFLMVWRPLSRRLVGDQAEATSDLGSLPRLLNQLLTTITRLDMAICRRLSSRVGTSVFSVAIKIEN